MRKLTLILPLTLILTACPDQKKPAPSKLIQIRGNPMAFVENRRMTRVSTFREDQFDLNSNYQVNVSGFENMDARKTDMRGADPANGERRLANLANSFYRFSKRPNGDLDLKAVSGRGLEFRFTPYQGYLELSALYSTKGTPLTEQDGAYRLLNYSSSPDGQRHSILLFTETGRRQTLMAVHIQKVSEAKVKMVKTDAPYNYLFGRGVKAPWRADEPVTVLFCTPEAPEYIYQDFKRAVGEWQAHLNGRLQLETRRENFCPSYDDVNTRTYGFAPEWIEIPGAQRGVYGWTLVNPNVERSEIVDGDIFILSKEIQESIDYYWKGRGLFDQQHVAVPGLKEILHQVALHELGHLLGLHHMFDGPKSVMDYEDVDYVAEYDRNAIQALYPLFHAVTGL